MARRNSKPSMKSIRETLMQSVFDPRDRSTPMSILVDMEDPGYCESKAIELISEAKKLQKEIASPPEDFSNSNLKEQYDEKMAQAISLLALARVQRNDVVHS